MAVSEQHENIKGLHAQSLTLHSRRGRPHSAARLSDGLWDRHWYDKNGREGERRLTRLCSWVYSHSSRVQQLIRSQSFRAKASPEWHRCNREFVSASPQLGADSYSITKLPGLPTAAGSIGMLSYDLEGIKIVFKALQDSSPWTYDSDILELPWRKDKYDSIVTRSCDVSGTEANGRLVFGILESDDHVTPHPPIRLALQRVKQALISCGYEVRFLLHLGYCVLMMG